MYGLDDRTNHPF